MTQAERYEKETGDNHYNRACDTYTPGYVEWLEAGKEKAEQERDEYKKQSHRFAAMIFLRMEHDEYRDESQAFMDKHKESV